LQAEERGLARLDAPPHLLRVGARVRAGATVRVSARARVRVRARVS